MRAERKRSVIVASSLEGAGSGELTGYLVHAFCHTGYCEFCFNSVKYKMEAGDCMVCRRTDLLMGIAPSDDFKADVIYITPEFIEVSTPQSNYGMKGSMALFNNPIMRLTPEQQKVCALDFDFIKRRLSLNTHRFHHDAMRNAVECMIIDLYDFHAHLYGSEKISTQHFRIVEQFHQLLERGDFRKNRNLDYYAEKLCVTSKYLSEVSKTVSGFPANYWITRYTVLDISRNLRNRHRTLADLADMYGFSSPSYFTQYVQKHLGAAPSEFRD